MKWLLVFILLDVESKTIVIGGDNTFLLENPKETSFFAFFPDIGKQAKVLDFLKALAIRFDFLIYQIRCTQAVQHVCQ